MAQTGSTLLMGVRDPADAEAWGEFVALYEPLLTAYLQHQGLGPEDTRDVVQDVFARLVKSLPDFELERGRGRFRNWLWRVCRNTLVDWARRRRRRARAGAAWWGRRSESPAESQDDLDSRWETLHRHRVLAFALERVRARTRPTTWACFERHLLHGRPSAEVAA